jgi:diguanylate cyclase (GGDEF)-like protein
MNRNHNRREYIAVAAVVVLFLSMSVLSLASLQELRGHSRVVNFNAMVRSAGQMIVKNELMAKQNGEGSTEDDDALIEQVDGIINELLTGRGEHGLVVLDDEKYMKEMLNVRYEWNALKAEIYRVREGAPPDRMFALSRSCNDVANRAISAAENFSESQVGQMLALLYGANVAFAIFVIITVISWLKRMSMKKTADLLGKIAYEDPLTQMSNRASCERVIDEIKNRPPPDDVAVLIFDMNNLKLVNDLLGHQGGDRVIKHFSYILRTEAEKYGFIGRYGGDEFLAVFNEASPNLVEKFISGLDERLRAFNALRVNDIEKINYAVGYVCGDPRALGIDNMIYDADKRMYENKRRSKGHCAQFGARPFADM